MIEFRYCRHASNIGAASILLAGCGDEVALYNYPKGGGYQTIAGVFDVRRILYYARS